MQEGFKQDRFEGMGRREIEAQQKEAWNGGAREDFYDALSYVKNVDELVALSDDRTVGVEGPGTERKPEGQQYFNKADFTVTEEYIERSGDQREVGTKPQFAPVRLLPGHIVQGIESTLKDTSGKGDLIERVVAEVTGEIDNEEGFEVHADPEFKQWLEGFLRGNGELTEEQEAEWNDGAISEEIEQDKQKLRLENLSHELKRAMESSS